MHELQRFLRASAARSLYRNALRIVVRAPKHLQEELRTAARQQMEESRRLRATCSESEVDQQEKHLLAIGKKQVKELQQIVDRTT